MAASLGTKNTAVDVTSEEVRQTLDRILQSKYFSHAPKKQKFIQLICDYHLQGRTSELNEYVIGYEVFEKGTGYNPSTDPVVRVGAHDVRKKLELYYQHEGAEDAVRLVIPLGTYIPVFMRAADSTPSATISIPPLDQEIEKNDLPPFRDESLPAPSSTKVSSPVATSFIAQAERRIARSAKAFLMLTGVTILLLAAMIVWLINQNRALQRRVGVTTISPMQEQSLAQGMWSLFLSNQVSTLLVLSNPVVYRTVNGADPEILAKRGVNLTSEQANLLINISSDRLPLRPNQPLQLIPAFNMYTGIGEAIGAYRLQGLLQSLGETSLLKQSRNVGAEDLKDHDVILLGSVYSNQWAKPLSIKENFVYSSRTSIENLAPREGEQREYVSLFDQRTGALLEDYALITVVPGVSGATTVMSLSGIYSEGTQAAAEYVTDPAHLAQLHQQLIQRKTNGDVPRYFQALLKVRVENSFPTQITLLTVREL
jgi:hypothetical protein